MARSFNFSSKITSFCSILALGMLMMAYWQWTRHLEKLAFIAELNQRYEVNPTPLTDIESQLVVDPLSFVHRRVLISGKYDFQHQMYLRNQRLGNSPGVHVITPLIISSSRSDSDLAILIDRGFLPLHLLKDPETIKRIDANSEASFTGLLKEGKMESLLAPKDPEIIPGGDFVQNWLRVNIGKIQLQLPYQLLSLYAEIVPGDKSASDIVKDQSGQSELLFLPMAGSKKVEMIDENNLPNPVFSTVVPAGRHLGYVFEWSFMALGVLLVGILLQFRAPKILK